MLKGIDSAVSPDLIKILMEMRHGDEIIFADRNFPSARLAAAGGNRLVRLDGHGIPRLLRAVLPLFPLDDYVDSPVALMQVVPGDPVKAVIWEEYASIIGQHAPSARFCYLDRYAYYERAQNAYAIVATGEDARYANILLKKGCVLS